MQVSTSHAAERGGAFRRSGPDHVKSARPFWSALLLIASGTAALIYQVLWIKQLTLIVGIDVYAVTLGVSAFFAGLALGGLVIGCWVDRVTRPLRLYAALETGVALIGVAMTIALAHTPALFASLEEKSVLLAWGLTFLMVTVGPFLMGGTLPAVVRSLGLNEERIGSGGGHMYAANTIGAIIGALASSFYLIPALGIQGTGWAAAGIGLIAAAGGLWLDPVVPRTTAIESHSSPARIAKSPSVAFLLYSIAGGLALGYEVVWSQSIVQFMSTRSFALSVMLATYLAGLALGAALFAHLADRVRDPWGMFGLLIAAAGLVALLEMTLLGPWLPKLQSMGEQAVLSMTASRLAGMCARFAIAALYIVFLPTLLLGAAFPAALKLIVDSEHVGRDIGKVVALNTLGGIVGTVTTGFLLVPRFGLVNTLAILAVVAAMLGLLAALRSTSGFRAARWGAIVIAILTAGAALLTPSDRLAGLLADTRGGTMVFYEEGRGGTVAVLEQQAGRKQFHRLYIQGVSNTGDAMPSLRYMRLQALLPLIIHRGEPTSALVIGLGTGITSGALLRFPGLEQRVVVELLPEVVQAASNFQGNFGASTDHRIDIRLRDGRRELLSHEQTYDLITLEPPPPSAAGVVNLYSSGFYELARARLRPNGLVAQWLPLPTQNDEDTRSLVRSFLDVFPHVSLWTTELHEMLLVGSREPIELDVSRIVERFDSPGVSSALREVGISSPQSLLGTWLTDRAGLEAYAGDALPVTDDQPRIEYADWVRYDELQRVLPKVIGLRTDPPLHGANDVFMKAVATERQRLLLFYQAALNAQSGYPELWARDMQRVLEGDGGNAYYRWFLESRN
ncbi:MAG: fused MFS/spermidine synthase [Nitrospira sp.]|nr:fused MFS/spermidine synthase [Nitrospira sp.]MDH4245759.1 fused MFS/spermidine synthase [Nitrospira sp.]MDH4355688.1 fused MFS/spermidine synthase [Nitrospira sp.]MDH5319461.1 fused MFS/spermidine synthase [Nitrospira sp.]